MVGAERRRRGSSRLRIPRAERVKEHAARMRRAGEGEGRRRPGGAGAGERSVAWRVAALVEPEGRKRARVYSSGRPQASRLECVLFFFLGASPLSATWCWCHEQLFWIFFLTLVLDFL
jgi:hypothetical protein